MFKLNIGQTSYTAPKFGPLIQVSQSKDFTTYSATVDVPGDEGPGYKVEYLIKRTNATQKIVQINETGTPAPDKLSKTATDLLKKKVGAAVLKFHQLTTPPNRFSSAGNVKEVTWEKMGPAVATAKVTYQWNDEGFHLTDIYSVNVSAHTENIIEIKFVSSTDRPQN